MALERPALFVERCATRAAAEARAAALRATLLRGTDWTVSIAGPLFPGDPFRVVVR